MDAIYLGTLWVLYYVLHSVFAADWVKQYFKDLFPAIYPHYRAMYSTIAIVNFVLLAGLHIRVPSQYFVEPGSTSTFVALLFALLGGVVIANAMANYGFLYFMRETEQAILITTGLNAYVRHPLYFGVILLLIALLLGLPNMKNAVFTGISFIYLFVGTALEERKLLEKFGKDYQAYQKRTKMLIPYLF